MDYQTIRYKDITVYYRKSHNGGGTTFGQEYLEVVKEKFGKVGHVFEFCAGPGFIGFSLLAHGLCEKLTLADLNAGAIKDARETIRRNHLEDRVTVYESDVLDGIPKTEQWDLVVGNPPHYWTGTEDAYQEDMRKYDPNLRIHKKFYETVRPFLAPYGSIVIQENVRATRSEDFREMIEANGLAIREVFQAKPSSVLSYFLRGKNPRVYSVPLQFKIWEPTKSGYYFIWSSARSPSPVEGDILLRR